MPLERLTPRPLVVAWMHPRPTDVYWSMDDRYTLTFFEVEDTPGLMAPKQIDHQIRVLRGWDPRLMSVLVAGSEEHCRRYIDGCKQPDFIIVVDPDKDKLRRLGVEVIMDEDWQPGQHLGPAFLQLATRFGVELRQFVFPRGVDFERTAREATEKAMGESGSPEVQ